MKKIIVTFIGLSFVLAFALNVTNIIGASNPETSDVFVMQDKDAALTSSMEAGKAIYEGKGTCHICHQVTGTGLPPAFPPLAKADYLLADKKRAIKQTLSGSKTPITVNGVTYPGGIMTVVELTDQEVMDVVNYIMNSWGNDGGVVTLDEVKAVRK